MSEAKLDRQANSANISGKKTGVLLANLGTPDSTGYWAMRRYLSEFLSDPYVVDRPAWMWQPVLQLVILSKRPFSSGAAYRTIWNNEANESPLLTITKQQTAKISTALAKLHGDDVIVDYCMRYGNPSIRSKVAAMVNAGCERILFFPLYPQFAGATTQTANVEFERSLRLVQNQPEFKTVPAYYENTTFIDGLAESVELTYAEMNQEPDVLVASYHGLPQRIVDAGDPYYDHCIGTTALLKNRLGFTDDQIVSTFQSRFGPEEWLQPYTVKEVAELARQGKKRIAVIAPAFSADCIETLEEINEEIRDSFIEAGGESFTYIPCLNDNDAHIAALVQIIQDNLSGWTE